MTLAAGRGPAETGSRRARLGTHFMPRGTGPGKQARAAWRGHQPASRYGHRGEACIANING